MILEIINYEHDGLTQKKISNYNSHSSTSLSQSDIFQIDIRLNLPLFLTIPVWIRHGYSLIDIRTTLDYFSALHLWQCALLFGIPISSSAIKISFATPDAMIYGSKAIVIKKIERILRQTSLFDQSNTILDTSRDDHIPPLPLHKVDTNFYNVLLGILPKNQLDIMCKIHFEKYISWKDISVVPLWIEKRAIYCVRIIPTDIYKSSGRTLRHDQLSTRPLDICIGNVSYAGLEEAMFFMCDRYSAENSE